MRKPIRAGIRSIRSAPPVILMMGLLALAAALGLSGCSPKERAAGVGTLDREVPPREVSPAAPGETTSPDAKISNAPVPPVASEQPAEQDRGGSPGKPPTAPPGTPPQGQGEARSPGIKTPNVSATPAPREAPREKPKVEPSSRKPAATPALNLKSLETRLRETKAIGMFTKLALKNQVDDLLAQFRAFHEGKGTSTPSELRESYDLLMMKVLSLLQDSDPPLARDILASREAIWSLLADPAKFATLP